MILPFEAIVNQSTIRCVDPKSEAAAEPYLRVSGRDRPPFSSTACARSMASAPPFLEGIRAAHGSDEAAARPASLDAVGSAEQDPVASHGEGRGARERRQAALRQALGPLLWLAGRP
jgi:hypothetical protein